MENGEPFPDVVKQYVAYLYRHIREKNVFEILSMYEKSFPKITDLYFKASPWPSVDAISSFVDNDHVFCLLYKEMYYRHIYATLQPTLEQRCESWDNYCSLFGVVLHGNVNMQLPNLWLWDMIDEFIYQFQSFCQYRGKLTMKSPEELELLKQCDQVWSVLGVCNYLQALIDKSGIEQVLADERAGKNEFGANEGYEYNMSNVLRTLGYYSLIGLNRVHCILGDYYGALRAIDPVALDKPGMFTKVPGSHVNTLYYVGFCYLMMRRYTDAIRTFNSLLLYISRSKGQYSQSQNVYELVMKKNEQASALLAVAVALCPAHKLVDESVSNVVRDKYGEKMIKMAQGDTDAYDELFSFACPKFITPSPPAYDDPNINYNQEAYRLQLRMFLGEVRSQQMVPTLRSFLKLYTTIPLAKLAVLMEVDEATLRHQLLCLKHKTHVHEFRGGESALEGVLTSTSDIDFYIKEGMVHVGDSKTARLYGDFFVGHISRFEQVIKDVKATGRGELYGAPVYT